ncbi:MAG: hypothetical protein ACM31L_18450 [Actinomycetota bacterium]
MSPTLRRLPLLMAGALSLLAGMAAGEGRMGWPAAGPDLALVHGPLMVCGFFGTVIGLERAVALGRPWGWAAPAATALGGLLLVLGHAQAGALALTAGSLAFLAMALAVIRRQSEAFTAVLGLGAAAWVAGNLAWLAGMTIGAVVPLWAAFLVLTIAGERLELSRFLPPWRWRSFTLVPIVVLLATGLASWLAFGLGLLALVAWSLRNDVVRRTIRQPGLTRYVAVCLLSGYAWLAVAGVAALGLAPGEAAGFGYDVALHALFVGFVFAMVFGHAPVILPAVLKVQVPFRLYFYGPLALLHLSLAARLAGDLLEDATLRQWGGLANAVAIVVFLVTMAGTVIFCAPRPSTSSASPAR